MISLSVLLGKSLSVKFLDVLYRVLILETKNNFNDKIFGKQKERENRKKMLGSFFTPESLAELVSKITLHENEHTKRVYDPTCGSGSLLLKFTEYSNAQVFGQDIEQETIDDIRDNIPTGTFECADTLTYPKFTEYKFDTIISNPPYSCSWERDNFINDKRFNGFLAPKSKSDLAFLQHSLSYLSETGTATFVCFPGIMYRGGAEQKIRRHFIENNVIDTVIQLPENLFLDTSISTVIIVMKKNKQTNKTLFINASELCEKQGKTNVLTDENMQTILDIFKNKKSVQYVSKNVEFSEIENNDFNLSVTQYVEQEDKREIIDIDELNAKILTMQEKRRTAEDKLNAFVAQLDKELKGIDAKSESDDKVRLSNTKQVHKCKQDERIQRKPNEERSDTSCNSSFFRKESKNSVQSQLQMVFKE